MQKHGLKSIKDSRTQGFNFQKPDGVVTWALTVTVFSKIDLTNDRVKKEVDHWRKYWKYFIGRIL